MREPSPILSTIIAARADGLSEDAIERRVWERHGTTCAMLALDSSGMTRFSRSHGIVHFLTCYVQMRDMAEVILQRHACLGWRCFADNLFSEFPDVDAALGAALEIHRTLRERGLMVADHEPYRVCIGIGHGRVLDDGAGGKMGDEMNIVAKLAEDVAEAGQTLLSEAAFRRLSVRAAVPVEKIALCLSKVDVTCYRVRA